MFSVFFSFFVGCISETNTFPIPLYIRLSQMNGYIKYFNRNTFMNLLVHDNELLKKYNAICDKLSNLLQKEFHSEPVYDDKYIKIKIKIYNNKISTNFHGNKIPEDNE